MYLNDLSTDISNKNLKTSVVMKESTTVIISGKLKLEDHIF